MKLGTLLGSDDLTPVTGFAIDHRKVAPGNVFGAFPGMTVNGEDFIDAAIAAGAIAVVARPGARVEGALAGVRRAGGLAGAGGFGGTGGLAGAGGVFFLGRDDAR